MSWNECSAWSVLDLPAFSSAATSRCLRFRCYSSRSDWTESALEPCTSKLWPHIQAACDSTCWWRCVLLCRSALQVAVHPLHIHHLLAHHTLTPPSAPRTSRTASPRSSRPALTRRRSTRPRSSRTGPHSSRSSRAKRRCARSCATARSSSGGSSSSIPSRPRTRPSSRTLSGNWPLVKVRPPLWTP